MATPNYEIDYTDKRFTDVKAAETDAINKNNTFYNTAVNDITTAIDTQKTNSENWGKEQAKNQQAQTDQTIKQINQQKEYAQQDYQKEQSGAYVDWQKQSNQYGANAEQMAAGGLANTGYSESSQVAMYNQYQNRVAVAREAMVRANTEFENQITQAKLQNSSILAEIAYNTLKEVSALTLSGIQQTTALRTEQARRETELKQIYHNQWQDVLKQINTENSLAESVRQYNETMEFNKQKEANDKAYQEAALALEREKFDWQKAQASASGGTIEKSGGGSSGGRKYTGSTKVTKSSGTKVGSGSSTINNSNHKATNTTATSNNKTSNKSTKLSAASWKMVDDGGINWFWGVDGNAKYKNTSTGKTYTGDQLVKALQKEGMSKSAAKEYVKALQKGAGA